MKYQHAPFKLRNAFLLLAIANCTSAIAAETKDNERTLAPIAVKDSVIDTKTYNPGVSTSGTKSNAPLRDVPQTINVIPAQVIRDQAATSLQDVMKNIPGIGLSTGDGQRDQVFIRGFTAIADQFVDGFRDDALYFRDLSNVERVDVIKGPAAVLYGRGSSGGLINRITKKPGIDVTDLTFSYCSWDDKRAEADIARKGDSVSWRITGAKEDADSYRDQQFLKRTAITPSVLIDLNEQSSLLLQADYLDDERVTDFGIPAFHGKPVNVDPSEYYGAGNADDVDTSRSVVKSLKADYTYEFDENLSLRNGFRYYHYNLVRNNTLVGAVNEVAQTASLNRSNFYRNELGFFNQTEITHKVDIANVHNEFLYGVEFGRQKKDQLLRSGNNIATIALFDPVLPIFPEKLTSAPTTDNLGTFDTSAAYVQDLASFGQHWKALLGVRFDRFKQETDDRRAGQIDLSRTDNMLSPRAGLVWQPTDTQSYYLTVSKSYQPSGEAFALAANNTDISPEETINQEIGAKLDFLDGRLSTTASLFRLERSDIKATNPATNQLVAVGKQRTDGIELTIAGDFGSGWNVLAGYAYLDSHVIESIALDAGQTVDGNRATLTPYNSANVWITKSIATHYGVGVGGNYVGDRFANPGNTVTLSEYSTADAMAWARFDTVEFQLNVRNLFNREYIGSAHGSSPNLNLPGAPRNATVSVRLKF
ncbi:MAG: TonB-dependent siderophore receptor family protein 13 [Verrucomicrobiaceae bacterium]|nr:TonB-dependent siderophore receptor family protein 13 [Verrucomicrobiaceae bacterium]